ncbi:hypothetical protein ABEF91_007334 [Exophiala dermatitidis]
MANPMTQPMGQPVTGGDWENGLCECSCGSCIIGTCVPCLLVGRTSERLRDPSMRDPESINGDCMIHGFLSVFTGLAWIFTMMKRTEIREQFGIPGSSFGDCCTAYWCPCCAVIQQDNEVKFRLKPVADMTQQPYQPQQDQMVMQNSFASAPPNYTPAPNYPPAQK